MTYKIAVITHRSDFYGAPQCLYLFLQQVDPSIIEAIVICPEQGLFYDMVLLAGYKTHLIEKFPPLTDSRITSRAPFSMLRKLYYRCRYMIRLAILLKREHVDLAYVNTIQNSSSVLASILTNVPVLSHIHELDWRFEQTGFIRVQIVLRGARAFLAVSNAAKKTLIRHGIKRKRIRVAYNGVDLARFNRSRVEKRSKELRDDIGIGEGSLIGAFSGLQVQKGIHFLIEAIPSVLSVCPHSSVIIVGDTPARTSRRYLDKLQQRCAELGIDDRVVFLGFRDDVEFVMGMLGVVVIPSMEESFGRVAIEAMALEIPVVASNVGGLPEIIEEDISGLLVDPGDSETLAQAIIQVLENPDQAKRLGRSGRKRVEELFSVDTYGQIIQEEILRLVSR